MQYTLSSGKVVNITNTMADGTVRDSMEGYVLEYNENTKHIFETAEAICRQIHARKMKEMSIK